MAKEIEPEQEFKICSLKLQIQTMSESEVKHLLIQTYQQMQEMENYYQREIKKAWIGEE